MRKILLLTILLSFAFGQATNEKSNRFYKRIESEWIQYKKLEWKVPSSFVGIQFDLNEFSIRLEISSAEKMNIIFHEKKYLNDDYLYNDDETMELVWNGKIYQVDELKIDSSDDNILNESLDKIEKSVSAVSVGVKNLYGGNNAYAYETETNPIRLPYPQNGLYYGIVDNSLISEFFKSSSLDDVQLMLNIVLDDNVYIIGIPSIPQELIANYKSKIK